MEFKNAESRKTFFVVLRGNICLALIFNLYTLLEFYVLHKRSSNNAPFVEQHVYRNLSHKIVSFVFQI